MIDPDYKNLGRTNLANWLLSTKIDLTVEKYNELVIRSNMTINLSLKGKKIENIDAELIVLLHQGATHVFF